MIRTGASMHSSIANRIVCSTASSSFGRLSSSTIITPSSATASFSSRLFSSSSTPSKPSALLTPQEMVEHELALSSERRLERMKRLEELQTLETLLMQHKLIESQSLSYSFKKHWKAYGPILTAILCGGASLTASFALWKSGYFRQVALDENKVAIDSIRVQQAELERSNERDAFQMKAMLRNYMDAKSVLVASSQPIDSVAGSASRGWFGWFGGASKPAPPAAALSSSSTTDNNTTIAPRTIQQKTYTASKADLAKLTQLEKDVAQVFAA